MTTMRDLMLSIFIFLLGHGEATDTPVDMAADRHLRRRRHRRLGQQPQIQQQFQAKRQNRDIPPINILSDTPREGLWSRFHGTGPHKDVSIMGQTSILKRPAKDAARPLTLGQIQVVYVSFASGGEYFLDAVHDYNPNIVSQIGPFPLYEYSHWEKEEIIARMRADYTGFPVEFVTEEPVEGPFATIEINSNTFLEVLVDEDMGILAYTAVLFGEAQFIDFMNVVPNDFASVDANFWSLLVLLGDVDLFYFLAGLDQETIPVEKALSQVMVTSTANTAAHELGHLLGLRHYDSIASSGDRVSDPNTAGNILLDFVPVYEGAFNAEDTFKHLLASGSSVGLSFEDAARLNRFFSDRSALKLALAFSTDPPLLTEGDFVGDSPIKLSDIIIPNTRPSEDNAGPLLMQASLIEGNISSDGEVDIYTFMLEGDRLLTAEVASVVDATQLDDVITRIQVFKQLPDGSFSFVIESYQEIESFDPVVLDLPIPASGVYKIHVDAPRTVFVDESGYFAGSNPVDISTLDGGANYLTGNYKLLVYSSDRGVLKPVPLYATLNETDTSSPTSAPNPGNVTSVQTQAPAPVPIMTPNLGNGMNPPTRPPSSGSTVTPTGSPNQKNPTSSPTIVRGRINTPTPISPPTIVNDRTMAPTAIDDATISPTSSPMIQDNAPTRAQSTSFPTQSPFTAHPTRTAFSVAPKTSILTRSPVVFQPSIHIQPTQTQNSVKPPFHHKEKANGKARSDPFVLFSSSSKSKKSGSSKPQMRRSSKQNSGRMGKSHKRKSHKHKRSKNKSKKKGKASSASSSSGPKYPVYYRSGVEPISYDSKKYSGTIVKGKTVYPAKFFMTGTGKGEKSQKSAKKKSSPKASYQSDKYYLYSSHRSGGSGKMNRVDLFLLRGGR